MGQQNLNLFFIPFSSQYSNSADMSPLFNLVRGVMLEEPGAGSPHGGICEGGGPVSLWRS